jgi:hypothetical protein
VLLEELDDVLHAAADDQDHRLRLIRGERAQARAFAARHHDRLHFLTAFQTANTLGMPATATPEQHRSEEPQGPIRAGFGDEDERDRRVEDQVAALPRKLTEKS